MSTPSYWNLVSSNRNFVEKSKQCGCIYCQKVFESKQVKMYTDDGCAMCPHCWVDAVVPDHLVQITDQKLNDWHQEGFGKK